MLKLIVEAELVEGVLAEEVDSRQGQTSLAHTALHHLKYLSTGRRGEKGGKYLSTVLASTR